jgi:hypothetical protein
MKRYDVFVYRDRTFWMLDVPELGILGAAASRFTAPREARDLISLWFDHPDAHTPPPRIRWSPPHHDD